MTLRDSDLLETLDNKVALYESIVGHSIIDVPEYRLINSSDEFIRVYEEMSKSCENLCAKLVEDIGGKAFRVLDTASESLSLITNKLKLTISYKTVCSILKSNEDAGNKNTKFMVMELLNGLDY